MIGLVRPLPNAVRRGLPSILALTTVLALPPVLLGDMQRLLELPHERAHASRQGDSVADDCMA
ncbi:MAG TPA: hypothetical protein VIS96_16690 [Terrimicrobiaceae bacterium]